MSTFECVGALPLQIDSYELEDRRRDVSSAFTRRTTTVHLRGGEHAGLGEDVVYDAAMHERAQAAGPTLALEGRFTLESFSEHLAGLELFPGGPELRVARLYRSWAYESAALDLALRQAGLSLADALDRPLAPVRYVVSMRLGDPPSLEPLRRRLELYPRLELKLDPTSAWTDDLVAGLAELGAVVALDFKGKYKGTIVDQAPDAALYERVARGFPDALLEDPNLDTPETDAALAPYRDRISWDEPIHSIADVDALPFPPGAINVKPSRFGSVRALFDAYDELAARSIAVYGGGQFELGVGRGQVQYLASLFHADAPNDVAPGGFNDPEPSPGLPESPLGPPPNVPGFRWQPLP